MESNLAQFPYGAVYFRKSNPPREDWARDYATAAADGMNTFRHWFLWSAIEIAPGEYDWADYDRQLDLAAEVGIKTIIAEMITSAPEWAFRQYDHARLEGRDGRRAESGMSGSCVTGGYPGLCLDNDDYRQAAERFLTALVTRYREHPGLGGYDVWNECNYSADYCYCPATTERFREWLQGKYGDLRALGQAWHRHSFAAWEDVTPPRALGPYPHALDWLGFRLDNAYGWMRWRVELIRRLDPAHPITAHGIAAGLTQMAANGADDWRAAAEVESYGYTWIAARKGDETWKQFHAADLVRAAARGKRFWHAEAQAGPLWMQPQVIGRPREDGRIAAPEDVRYWNLVSMMGGATGILYPRWRPLLDGPLFGAFGAYGLDGARTPRSEMTSRIARWANDPAQADLWQARPVKGDIGIVYAPETQLFAYAQQGDTRYYSQSMQGAYQGFFDQNIQADWVRLDDIEGYDALYLPYPAMLKASSAARLIEWVKSGGTLVSEGCPGYFDDVGHVAPRQPGLGLDELFGVEESDVEFVPDLLEHSAPGDPAALDYGGHQVSGGLFRQAYAPTTGTARGRYADGRAAVVDNAYGRGRTRLVGTMVGYGYYAHHDAGTRAFFADALRFAGKQPQLAVSDARIRDARIPARLHAGGGHTYLWVANPLRQEVGVHVQLGASWGPFVSCRSLWGPPAEVGERAVALMLPGREVAVIELMQEITV